MGPPTEVQAGLRARKRDGTETWSHQLQRAVITPSLKSSQWNNPPHLSLLLPSSLTSTSHCSEAEGAKYFRPQRSASQSPEQTQKSRTVDLEGCVKNV